TIQVKVKVLQPDEYLRPEMNASVAFLSDEKSGATGSSARPLIVVPASAVKSDSVFVVLGGRAARRTVKTGATTSQGVQIQDGLMGPAGSGKSTLLHLIAAMDYATDGEIVVLGKNLRTLSDREIAHWRNENIGFVFQTFNLIPVLTALENVELPLKLTSLKKKERLEHATTALKLVGLGDRLSHYPRQLSGGQEQRVAIARAIVTDP